MKVIAEKELYLSCFAALHNLPQMFPPETSILLWSQYHNIILGKAARRVNALSAVLSVPHGLITQKVACEMLQVSSTEEGLRLRQSDSRGTDKMLPV